VADDAVEPGDVPEIPAPAEAAAEGALAAAPVVTAVPPEEAADAPAPGSTSTQSVPPAADADDADAAVPPLLAAEAAVQTELVFARIHGEPLMRLPQDLYIPPDALEVFLESFEGPLDLLLYLIRKQNFNIIDIPLAEVTRQYLAYIEEIRRHNLELAAEYLLMAALLIDIKSRMLLPVRKADTGEEVEDPRAELARRLLEYERIKLAAQHLDTVPQVDRDFLRTQVLLEQTIEQRLPDVNVIDLRGAWADILRRAKLVQHHRITREQLSVREHMTIVLRTLQDRRFAEFTDMFDPARGVPVVVVTFIALLELAKESLIEITQAAAYAPIYVRLAYSPS
jgi:segregation and condensation protein A